MTLFYSKLETEIPIEDRNRKSQCTPHPWPLSSDPAFHPLPLQPSYPQPKTEANLAQKMQPKPKTTFATLPLEVHLQISTHISFPSLPLLRLTNHYFYNLLPPLTHNQLLDSETFPFAIQRNLYTCKHHLTLLPSHKFAQTMLTKTRQRGDRKADKRFCLDCGLKYRLYSWGTWVRIEGESEGRVLCLDCKVWEFKRGFETNRWEKTSCWDCGSGVNVIEEAEVKERDFGAEKEVRVSREEGRQRRERGEVYEFGVRDDGETLGGMLETL